MASDRHGAGARELQRMLRTGYRVVSGSKHLKVEGPDGELVRTDDGRPLTFSRTMYVGKGMFKSLKAHGILSMRK